MSSARTLIMGMIAAIGPGPVAVPSVDPPNQATPPPRPPNSTLSYLLALCFVALVVVIATAVLFVARPGADNLNANMVAVGLIAAFAATIITGLFNIIKTGQAVTLAAQGAQQAAAAQQAAVTTAATAAQAVEQAAAAKTVADGASASAAQATVASTETKAEVAKIYEQMSDLLARLVTVTAVQARAEERATAEAAARAAVTPPPDSGPELKPPG